MTNASALATDHAPIRACTICRDVRNFDLLIEDMETELGDAWGDLSYEDAARFLSQPEATALEFVAIAIDEDDEGAVGAISGLIETAVTRGLAVIVIAEEVSPMVLHQLLKTGAKEFVPYPLPDGALHEAIERMRDEPSVEAAPSSTIAQFGATAARRGTIVPIQSLAGGAGTTTLAVNLAWELATLAVGKGETAPRVCLLDLNLQMGAVSTYLDLVPREAVLELLQNTDTMDGESFMQALQIHGERLHVLTAPADMLPLDLATPDDVGRIVEMAASQFDYVVIDMPSTFVMWTETVMELADLYLMLFELDMRSAQNALRMIRALKTDDMPDEKLRYVLNRAPKFTDLAGRSRLRRMSESLGIAIEMQLPDGGRQVTEANDQGLPLARAAKKNPLRRQIQKLATTFGEFGRAAASAS
ncbi:CpaE family protein [Palleronia sp. LCG004]|uniref:AAA family ATPase n=1 Tax=Palleronia sp. LCG004 TaxID=3079304 RepID=UPI002943E34D|nr:AAA family ATPase [Palleronia sp. LCG004]WOI55693.1 AAA family ATPase [Palleronia sp. LCG004]